MKNLFYALLLFAAWAKAQAPLSPLDGRQYGLILDHPGMKDVLVKSDITYLSDAKGALHMDLYLPPGLKKEDKRPVIVFLNAIGDYPGESKVKSWGIYTTWPRLMAANGYIGITMESDRDRIQESLEGIFDFIGKNAGQWNIDAEKMGIYAASANVRPSVTYLMGEHAHKGIRAAVLYYGSTPDGPYRKDLPVMSVIAEGDLLRSPGIADNLWKAVLANHAPWTLKMATGMPHAFDAFSDNDEARRIVIETVSFWKTYLDPTPAPGWKPAEGREVLGLLGIDRPKALEMLAAMSKKYPEDIGVLVNYARELEFSGQLAASEAIYLNVLKRQPDDNHAIMAIIVLLYKQGKKAEAEKYLAEALRSTKMDYQAYASLGFNLLVADQNAAAATCYEKSVSMKPEGGAYYNLACAYSKSQVPEKAFDALEKAIAFGYNDGRQYENDPDLFPLKADSRFKALLEKTE